MIPQAGINFRYLREAFVRRLWYVVLPFFVLSLAAVGYSVRAPRVYKSSTLILVQPQEVPLDYVRPTVTSDARSRLNTLKEQVMSRPRLEEIIKEYDLYPKLRASRSMSDAVETMRTHIGINVKATGGRRDTAPASFEVSYEGEHPAKVRDVTSAIANLFIDDDLRLREQQAAGTSNFLERELERMREQLRDREELVRQFKEEHMGLLPEQMENNYRILSQLQQHLDSVNQMLQQTEDRKVLLQGQLTRIEAVRVGTRQANREQGGTALDYAQLSLEELRKELETLKSRFTDKHPDVVVLKKAIARLENEKEVTLPQTDRHGQSTSSRLTEAERLMVAQREDLITQLKITDKEIRNLAKEKRQTSRQIEDYRQRIENGPRIEQMFLDLRRDYEEASENYQSLLQKKLQAELAENLERTQKGEQFTILEPPNLSQKPFKPDVSKILSMGFMLAMACGLGLAFLREYVDPTFWSSKELERFVQLPVLISVPIVHTEKEHRWNIVKRVGAIGALVSMASVLIYALFILWKIDPTAFPYPVG
ncbi:MAG TPA: hypothetical protein EYP19_04680 [Desulfobacterales bacterium]|nr:hypothetical protein [Desulfobacterales bacterium]